MKASELIKELSECEGDPEVVILIPPGWHGCHDKENPYHWVAGSIHCTMPRFGDEIAVSPLTLNEYKEINGFVL